MATRAFRPYRIVLDVDVESPVDEFSPQDPSPRGLHVIAYPAMLDVPRELVTYVARLLADERRVRGTRRNSRALTCGKQALFTVVWFRKREDIAVLGAGFGISRATAYRYHDEAVTRRQSQARVAGSEAHLYLVLRRGQSGFSPTKRRMCSSRRERVSSTEPDRYAEPSRTCSKIR